MSRRLQICMVVEGLARDEAGEPCPGMVSLQLGADDGQPITGDAYWALVQTIGIPAVLEQAGLAGMVQPSQCRFISPEEYDRGWDG